MLPFELTKDTPYLALLGELWSVFCEYFNRNWPCYKGFLLYIVLLTCSDITCLFSELKYHVSVGFPRSSWNIEHWITLIKAYTLSLIVYFIASVIYTVYSIWYTNSLSLFSSLFNFVSISVDRIISPIFFRYGHQCQWKKPWRILVKIIVMTLNNNKTWNIYIIYQINKSKM